MGRIVVWEAGFTGTNYDDSPVCTYTDDHYATWLEYYNNGTFSKRFNGDGYYSAYSYSSPMRVSFGTGI